MVAQVCEWSHTFSRGCSRGLVAAHEVGGWVGMKRCGRSTAGACLGLGAHEKFEASRGLFLGCWRGLAAHAIVHGCVCTYVRRQQAQVRSGGHVCVCERLGMSQRVCEWARPREVVDSRAYTRGRECERIRRWARICVRAHTYLPASACVSARAGVCAYTYASV
jgi:hypothetical protein